jgi:hypothetical protein
VSHPEYLVRRVPGTATGTATKSESVSHSVSRSVRHGPVGRSGRGEVGRSVRSGPTGIRSVPPPYAYPLACARQTSPAACDLSVTYGTIGMTGDLVKRMD